MRTEKEKMLAGEPYNAWDKELTKRVLNAKVHQKINNSIPDEE